MPHFDVMRTRAEVYLVMSLALTLVGFSPNCAFGEVHMISIAALSINL